MIDHLIVRDVTFVTNGFIHAKKLAVKGYKVFITGGEIKASTEAIVGAECVLTLKTTISQSALWVQTAYH